jgi:hypothetical protein
MILSNDKLRQDNLCQNETLELCQFLKLMENVEMQSMLIVEEIPVLLCIQSNV